MVSIPWVMDGGYTHGLVTLLSLVGWLKVDDGRLLAVHLQSGDVARSVHQKSVCLLVP